MPMTLPAPRFRAEVPLWMNCAGSGGIRSVRVSDGVLQPIPRSMISPALCTGASRRSVQDVPVASDVIEIVFETHSTTEDNEFGIATGWLPGQLSEMGRQQAVELRDRRAGDGFAAIFTSDLNRAVETAEIAFAGAGVPVLHDWRLRECDYGDRNGMPAAELQRGRLAHLDRAYPHGESWRQATTRVSRFVEDLPLRWHAGDRVLVIGHVATRWGFDLRLGGALLEDLVAEQFVWQPGWQYMLTVDS